MTFATTKNKWVSIEKEDIVYYRGTSYGTLISLKDGSFHELKDDFGTIDDIFDL